MTLHLVVRSGADESTTRFSSVEFSGITVGTYRIELTLDVVVSTGDMSTLFADFDSTIRIAASASLDGLAAVTSLDDCNKTNSVFATSAAVSSSGQPGAFSITLYFIPPSVDRLFFKAFAKAEDEPPLKRDKNLPAGALPAMGSGRSMTSKTDGERGSQ
jgi:hypothetical protein